MKPYISAILTILYFMLIPILKTYGQENIGILTPFASGFTSPVSIVHAGDSRLFVINQPGTIVIVDSLGVVKSEPFLDISEKVIFGGERGLLGMAFHPDFKTNGYFYLNYIGTGDSTCISRFRVMEGNPDKADVLSETKLLTIDQPFANHNGGTIIFGPDGYLYIGMGDGGSGGDPGNRAQNPNELLGKILRLDVNQGEPYTIPADNPFFGDSGKRNEIWAIGLRNPWKFSFDSRTGDLWIADVGQNVFEEINFQPAGSGGGTNFGWRCYEGNDAYETDGCAPANSLIFPVHTYPHGDECSVTGGYVYRGDSLSAQYGYYYFADYCSDRIRTLHKVGELWVTEDYGHFPGNNFSTFGEDYNGELYIAGHSSGEIYRLNATLTEVGTRESRIVIQVSQDISAGIIRVEMNRDVPSESTLSLYDLYGILHLRDVTIADNYVIHSSRFPPGTYVLTVTLPGKTFSQKLTFAP